MPDTVAMTPSAFKHWRKHLGLSQKEAAEALGLKRRVVQYYEKGERDGDLVAIPRTVRLACWALLNGVTDYPGPAEEPTARLKKAAKDAAKGAAKEAKETRNGKGAKEPKAASREAPRPASLSFAPEPRKGAKGATKADAPLAPVPEGVPEAPVGGEPS